MIQASAPSSLPKKLGAIYIGTSARCISKAELRSAFQDSGRSRDTPETPPGLAARARQRRFSIKSDGVAGGERRQISSH